jgi:hypothetical protein
MKSVLILMCMAATAAAQTRAVKPQEGPAPRPDKASLKTKGGTAPEVGFRGGTEVGFDDNILELNDKQISQLEDGNRPEKFRIDDPGDVVYSAWAEVKVKGRLFKDPTAAGLKIQPYFYQDSTIANYEEYELFVRQDLGSHEAGVELSLERDVYLRELEIVVPGPNLWESAYYDELTYEAYYKHRVHPQATLRGSIGWVTREFESPFTFRDREGLVLGIEPAVNLGKGWKAFVRYEFADLEADAGDFDADTSYREHEFELGASVDLLDKRLELSLRYRVGLRDYTTSNDPLFDPSHADREDRRQRLTFQAQVKVWKNWSLDARYEWRDVDSHRPFDDDATTSEPGDSTRNLFTFGVTFIL